MTELTATEGNDINLKRRDYLLALLSSLGDKNTENNPIDGRLRLMKGLFLIAEEVDKSLLNEFEPWTYGPINFKVYTDLEDLQKEKLLMDDKTQRISIGYYYLTKKGKAKAKRIIESFNDEQIDKIRDIKSTITKNSLRDLLKLVYSKYPEYATKSVINIS
ncbi:MAG: hypothetical protein ABSB40_06545 [Nitrososphaeria archaeon]|jgi:uncharacterized protein YwgA